MDRSNFFGIFVDRLLGCAMTLPLRLYHFKVEIRGALGC